MRIYAVGSQSAGDVYCTNQCVQHGNDVASLEPTRVLTETLVPVRAGGSERQGVAFDLDEASDRGGRAELARDAADGRGRNRRDLRDALGRIPREVFPQLLERRPTGDACRLTGAVERRLRERRVVVALRGAITAIAAGRE